MSVRYGYLKAVRLNWGAVVLDGRLVQLLGQQQTGVVGRYCAQLSPDYHHPIKCAFGVV